MQLPLNVILYRLSANSIYESQNTSLSKAYDGVKLFDRDYTPEDGKQYLYLMSEDILCSYSSRLLNSSFLPRILFCASARTRTPIPSSFTRDFLLYSFTQTTHFPMYSTKS